MQKISPCNPFYSTNSNMIAVTTELLVNNFISHVYVNVKQLDIRIPDSDKPNVKNSYRFKFKNATGVNIKTSISSSWHLTFDNDFSLYRIDGSSISGMTDLASYTLNGSVFLAVNAEQMVEKYAYPALILLINYRQELSPFLVSGKVLEQFLRPVPEYPGKLH